MALDAGKGLLPTLAAELLTDRDEIWAHATGLACAIGHVFPIWHGFRGGKGTATSIGVLLAVIPVVGAAAAAVFFALRALTGRASVGSLLATLAAAVLALALYGPDRSGLLAVAILVLVWIRHGKNLGLLLRGEEPPS
jgi:glycerol-3-phosphate acyltransferase PlsY